MTTSDMRQAVLQARREAYLSAALGAFERWDTGQQFVLGVLPESAIEAEYRTIRPLDAEAWAA